MNGKEGVFEGQAPAVAVTTTTSIDQLRALRASSVALLSENSREVKILDKRIARAEKGQSTGAYVAPAIVYKGEEVLDRITAVQAANEELLGRGGTIILKITGGDVRKLSLQPNQVRHISGNGMRRITQESPKGMNQAPRCVNVVDMPDGESFQVSAGNELAFDTHKEKSWE